MMSQEILKKITRLTKEKLDAIFGIALALHGFKELSLEERRSLAYLKEVVENADLLFQENVAGLETAFVSFYDRAAEENFLHNKQRKILALLAEYDALPEIGHACGHNMIAAISAGTFLVLEKFRSDFLHDLVLIGTPGEEHGGGKVTMVEKGFFKPVDGSVMIHPSNKTRVSCPMLNIKNIYFTFHGKSAHAAANPEKGINALDAMLQFFNAVNAYRQQLPKNSLIHGIITNGGVAPNIIPDRTEAHFCIRSLEDADYEMVHKRVLECAEGAAQQTGCRLEVAYGKMNYRSFIPNPVFAGVYRNALSEMGMEEGSFGEHEGLYSSDIGDVSHLMPSLHVELQLQEDIVWHSPPFAEATVGKRAKEFLLEAVVLNSLAVYEILTRKGLFEKAVKARSDNA